MSSARPSPSEERRRKGSVTSPAYARLCARRRYGELEDYVGVGRFCVPTAMQNMVRRSWRQRALEAETAVVVISASDLAHTVDQAQERSIFESMVVLTDL